MYALILGNEEIDRIDIERVQERDIDLIVIRYEIIGASLSGCFRKGTGDMVSPSGTRGAGSTKVRAGRR